MAHVAQYAGDVTESYSTFNLRTGFFYGTKPRTAGDRLSARSLTEPLNDFSPQYQEKQRGP